MNTSGYLDKWLYLLYLAFLISLVCAFRAVSSICIPLLLVSSIIKNRMDTGSFFNRRLRNKFFIACAVFYLVELLLLIRSPQDSAKLILLKSATLFVPLILCCSNYPGHVIYKKLMNHFVWMLAAAMLICLGAALYKFYFNLSGTHIFFYHDLVSIFKQHAIQVSILLFIGVVHLLETMKKAAFLINRMVHFSLIVYFTVCIILLSSKLVILFTVGCFFYYLFLFFKINKDVRLASILALLTGIFLIIVVLVSHNQVSKRFNEIIEGNMDLVRQPDFNPGIYFNGLQFRILQWRFVREILNEKKAWVTGVADEGQQLLDEKYKATHMYIGNGRTPGRGYLGYNTHNQFLECLLQSGIVGLVPFILICITMIMLAIKKKNRELSFVVALLLAYSLNESLLERQFSIIIFTFFPLLLYFSKNRTSRDIV